MDEIYMAKSGAKCLINKQTPRIVRRFVKKFAISRLEYAKSCIQLPTFVLPARLIRQIIDVVQSDDIPRTHLECRKIQLCAAYQGEISFFECLTGIIGKMLVRVEQDAE